MKLTNASATKYFYVTSTSFSTNTTVNITGGSDFSLASGAITGNYYGYGSSIPGFPGWFNWTPTPVGLTSPIYGSTRYGVLSMSGNMLFVFFAIDITSYSAYTGKVTIAKPFSFSTIGTIFGNSSLYRLGGSANDGSNAITLNTVDGGISFMNNDASDAVFWEASSRIFLQGNATFTII